MKNKSNVCFVAPSFDYGVITKENMDFNFIGDCRIIF
jgi:hypothetical protein